MLNPYSRQIAPNPSRDKRTLLVLIATTIIIGGAFFYAVMIASRDKIQDPTELSEENDWGGNFTERLGYQEIALPEDLRAMIREETETERVQRETEPCDYLLGEVADRPFAFFNQVGYRSVPSDLSASALLEKPDAYRAKQIALTGTLLRLEHRELPLPAPVAEIWKGEVRIDDATNEPLYAYFESVAEPTKLAVGDRTTVFGIFFKKFDFAVEDGEDSLLATGPFLLARKVKRSYEHIQVTKLDKNVLRRVRDTEPSEMLELEDEAWFHVVSYAMNLNPDEVRRKVTAETDLRQIYALPVAYRGELIRFRGRLRHMWKVPIEDNPAGLDAYYDSIIRTFDNVMVRARFVRKPTGLEPGDFVSVRAIFMKRFMYESQQSDVSAQVPLFAGVTIDKIEFRENALGQIQIILAVLALALVLVFTIALLLGRKSTKEFEQAYWARKRNRLKDLQLSPKAGTRPGELTDSGASEG